MAKWDARWYRSIAENGYALFPTGHPKGDAANWAFFPVLPLLARMLSHLSGFGVIESLLIISRIFFFGSIFLFISFVRSYNPNVPAWLSGALLAFCPYSIYSYTGYTEPVFLFFLLLSLNAYSQRNYLLAGLSGAFLTGTRAVGICILPALAIPELKSFFRKDLSTQLSIILCFLLIPLGLAFFMLHLYFLTGDALAWKHISVAWRSVDSWPAAMLETMGRSVSFIAWAILALISFIFAGILFKQKRTTLAILTLLSTAIPLSEGLWSMPRYLWWQPGWLLLIVELANYKRLYRIILPLFLAGLIAFQRIWISGMTLLV